MYLYCTEIADASRCRKPPASESAERAGEYLTSLFSLPMPIPSPCSAVELDRSLVNSPVQPAALHFIDTYRHVRGDHFTVGSLTTVKCILSSRDSNEVSKLMIIQISLSNKLKSRGQHRAAVIPVDTASTGRFTSLFPGITGLHQHGLVMPIHGS